MRGSVVKFTSNIVSLCMSPVAVIHQYPHLMRDGLNRFFQVFDGLQYVVHVAGDFQAAPFVLQNAIGTD